MGDITLPEAFWDQWYDKHHNCYQYMYHCNSLLTVHRPRTNPARSHTSHDSAVEELFSPCTVSCCEGYIDAVKNHVMKSFLVWFPDTQ